MNTRDDIELLLKIQKVDIKIDVGESKMKELPKKIENKKLEIKKEENDILELKKKLEKIQKERKLMELDVESNLTQIKKLQGKMYEVKTNKEYLALQGEIEGVKKSNSQIEEKILSKMFDEDEVKKDINKKLSEKMSEEKELVEVEKKCNEELKIVEEDLLKEKQQKNTLVENLNKKILSQYEKIRKAKSGTAVAVITKNTCSECFMEIRPQVLIEISKNNELVLCDSCFRILCIEQKVDEKKEQVCI